MGGRQQRHSTASSAWQQEEDWHHTPQSDSQGWNPPPPPAVPDPAPTRPAWRVQQEETIPEGMAPRERLVVQVSEPLFPHGVDLHNPPADLFSRSAQYADYDRRVREQTMYLLHNDPITLQASLKAWLTEMMRQATDRTHISTRRLGHMLYASRAI